MNIFNRLLIFCYLEELDLVFKDKLISIKSINLFYSSLLNFSIFLKLLIFAYLIFIFIINIILILIFFFKFKINFFNKIFRFVLNIPFLKNVHNFITANLLLHMEDNHRIY